MPVCIFLYFICLSPLFSLYQTFLFHPKSFLCLALCSPFLSLSLFPLFSSLRLSVSLSSLCFTSILNNLFLHFLTLYIYSHTHSLSPLLSPIPFTLSTFFFFSAYSTNYFSNFSFSPSLLFFFPHCLNVFSLSPLFRRIIHVLSLSLSIYL